MFKFLLIFSTVFCGIAGYSQKGKPAKPTTTTPTETKVVVRKVPFEQLVNINDVYYFNDKPFTGTSIEYFPQDAKTGLKTKMQEIQWKDGLLHGTKTEYFKGGVLVRAILTFNEGKRNGYFKYYHQNGQLKLCGKYINDLLDSTVNAFYDNGNPKYTFDYVLGVKTGTSISYFNNGNVEQRTKLVNELPDGVMETFYEAGNVRLLTTYKLGVREGKFLRYHLNGTVAEESYFKDGFQDSVSYYWDNAFGSILKIENYDMGKKEGIWVTFNEIGDTLTTYTYNDNILDGPYRIYMTEKIDHPTGVDAKGKKTYESEYIHELEEYGTYKMGKLDGEFKSGLHVRAKHVEGHYSNGVMVGEWKYFNEEEKMVLYELYNENGELIKQKPKLQITKQVDEEN